MVELSGVTLLNVSMCFSVCVCVYVYIMAAGDKRHENVHMETTLKSSIEEISTWMNEVLIQVSVKAVINPLCPIEF